MARGALLQRLVRARDYLHAEHVRGPKLDELARESGLSRAHLAREFASAFGVPPHRYLVQLRVDQAKRALAAGASVTDVCYGLGFASLGTFSSSFHRRVGMSPRAWQKLARPFVQSLGIPRLFVPACYFTAYVAHD
ncbi:MAG TPA: AraC family transcriptional regulator [Kofleriaceae bacterium]|nr:AraC family transcriptional regulator [Kofleriaceae bacterium]